MIYRCPRCGSAFPKGGNCPKCSPKYFVLLREEQAPATPGEAATLGAPRDGMIRLGYEVGSGAVVDIPIRHTIITGQTQEAGKTTALEAMIARSGLRALTFVTKRGEGSFTRARRIAPYFREHADWQFVASILEASRGEKMKFERAWIMRASQGTHTLAEVQHNVRRALDGDAARKIRPASGMSADVYLVLYNYLDVVVPQIASVPWARRVDLEPGVNAMDLTGLNIEMQHLVIKSSIDWVLEHETRTVVVVPEAWKFIPQGRGTPVKRSAEAYIRQAAGLGNYLWLDSQDIAGIEKLILKSVPLWILGVQRERNEIKRTLDEIPAGISKPKPDHVATLGLGQFFACWGTHTVKTYVQPEWLDAETAHEIARGKRRADSVKAPIPLDRFAVSQVAVAAARRTSSEPAVGHAEPAASIPPAGVGGLVPSEEDDDVNELERVKRENDELRRRLTGMEPKPLDVTGVPMVGVGKHDFRPGPLTVPARPMATMTDATYYDLRARLLEDAPAILKMIVSKPEVEVTVTRRTVEATDATLFGRLAMLMSEGFFDDTRTASAANAEFQRRAFRCAKPNVYREADKLAALGFLTKEPGGYRAVPGMKVNVVNAR